MDLSTYTMTVFSIAVKNVHGPLQISFSRCLVSMINAWKIRDTKALLYRKRSFTYELYSTSYSARRITKCYNDYMYPTIRSSFGLNKVSFGHVRAVEESWSSTPSHRANHFFHTQCG